MAEKSRPLDVWIVETNAVYREVPFAIVTDWIQQGRLLADDKARPSGTTNWFPLARIPAFAPYFPKPEPHRAEDKAEALEPVEMGFRWKRGEGEEGDPDMIPLIDISLVLLIFFMMIATVQRGMSAAIATPPARHQLAELDQGYWFGIDQDKDGATQYSLGKSKQTLEQPVNKVVQVLDRLKRELGQDHSSAEATVRIRAHRRVAVETIQDTVVRLQEVERAVNNARAKGEKLKLRIYAEVSEPGS